MTTRELVVAEAQRWVGTPYVHMGRLRGIGTDCAMLAAEVYRAAGCITHVDTEIYSQQWHLNRRGEKYLEKVLTYATEIDAPGPGDLVLYRFGRAFAHGAIVVDWPRVIHADIRARRVVGALGDQGLLGSVPRRYFTVWP